MAGYDYVRAYYGVDPKPGQRVRHNEIDRFGVVAPEGSQGHYVMVILDGAPEPSPCHPTSLDYDADDRQLLPMWVIYDHPSDHPNSFVARRWVTLPEPLFTAEFRTAVDLVELQEGFTRDGLVAIARHPFDGAGLLEVWL